MLKLFILSTLLFFSSCGGGVTNVYDELTAITIDSSNDRLFLFQPRAELFVLVATSGETIGDTPFVSEDNDETTHALLPQTASHMGVFATGSSSRLFIMGMMAETNGNYVNHLIRVLDFNGTSFTETSFSPITLSDGDVTTEESDNNFGDLLVDQQNAVVYITDATSGLLYAINANDGSTTAGPFNLGGNPQGMSLDGSGRLYVCNSSAIDATQLISVLNTLDFSVNTVDIGDPCSVVAAKTIGGSTLMLVKVSDEQVVLIANLNTTTFTITSIPAGESPFAPGRLTSGLGISSSIADILIAKDSSNTFYAYLSEADGNIEFITIDANLTSYALTGIETPVTDLTAADQLIDSQGNMVVGYMVSETGALVVLEVGSSEVETNLLRKSPI